MNDGVPGDKVAIKINPIADEEEREKYVSDFLSREGNFLRHKLL